MSIRDWFLRAIDRSISGPLDKPGEPAPIAAPRIVFFDNERWRSLAMDDVVEPRSGWRLIKLHPDGTFNGYIYRNGGWASA